MMDAQLVVNARSDIGESPIWEQSSGSLVWVDIVARRLNRFSPTSGVLETKLMPSATGAVAPRTSGGYVLALEDGFWLMDDFSAAPYRVAGLPGHPPGNRMNDGKCDPQGRFWAGSMSYEWASRPGSGSLYRLDPDGTVTMRLAGLTIANGLAWSADAPRFYYIDSATHAIETFDYSSTEGEIRNRAVLVEVPVEQGTPDGLTIDRDGYLWVAMWGAGAVHRYSPEGVLDTVVRIPASQVTSCTFGGPELDELYVTTARTGLSDAELTEQPLAGAVFRCTPGHVGLPVDQYSG